MEHDVLCRAAAVTVPLLLQWLFIIEGVPSVLLGVAMMVSSSSSSGSGKAMAAAAHDGAPSWQQQQCMCVALLFESETC
jgi:hypothetical protein